MKKITHILNPIKVEHSSDLYKVQLISFRSIYVAKLFANKSENIKLCTKQYPEDHVIVPSYFLKQPDLQRSILDIFLFKYHKKLPLIADLLTIPEEADYYIYSNIDISLMPYFYDSIAQYIEAGYDGIAINRRTISNQYTSPAQLPLMYAEAGKPHEGIDCFIFSRAALEQFNFFHAFIGSGPVGLCFVANMITFCKKFIWLEDKHLTFHLGDDKSWMNPKYVDYQIENYKQLTNICLYCLQQEGQLDGAKRKVLEAILEEANGFVAYLKQESTNFPPSAKILIRQYSKGDMATLEAASEIVSTTKLSIWGKRIKNKLRQWLE